MKKFMIGALLLCFAFTATAQNDKKHEVSLSYGMLTSPEVEDVVLDIVGAVFGVSYGDDSFTGAFNAEYMYHLNHRFAVGAAYTFENGSKDIVAESQKIGKVKDAYHSVMLGGKYYWLHKSAFRMYGKLEAGMTFISEKTSGLTTNNYVSATDDSSTRLAYQVSPIAVEFGKDVAGFVELGYGVQGVLQLGVKLHF